MFLCIGSSYTFILSRQTEEPIDGAIIKYAKDLYEQLGKKNNSAITKNELVEYVKEKVFGQGINNIPDILNVLTNTGTEENKDVEK